MKLAFVGRDPHNQQDKTEEVFDSKQFVT